MNIKDMLKKTENFTPAECAVSDYILKSGDFGRESLATIARGSYTSNAAVVRMCRKLGFSGFREFQLALLAEQMTAAREREQFEALVPIRPAAVFIFEDDNDSWLFKDEMDSLTKKGCHVVILPR